MDRDFNQEEDDDGERSGRPSPEEVDRFVEAVLGKKLTPTDPEAKARDDRKFLEWAAKISTRHEQELRDLERKEEAERRSANLSRWVDSVMGVEEAEWDPSQHPRVSKGEPDGGQWVAKGGSGSAQHSDHSGAAGEPVAVDQHSVPPQMLELANTWWQTNGVLQQYRRDIERLPARIANGQAQLGSGGRHADIRARNLAKDQQDLATATALAPQLEEQLRALEQIYRDAGYDKVEYSTWTPGETLISGRGIEEVGRAFEMGGSPAGLKPTGIEIDLALAAGAVLQLGKMVFRKALSKAPKSFFKPSVSDPKLQNITQDLYKGAKTSNPMGSGSTADAIRNELKTGQATYGRFHSQKGQEYARALEKWLQKNPKASAADRAAAQQMLNDLRSALEGN